MVRSGYLSLGTWRGTAVRLHWTAPVAAVLLGRLRLVPGFWVGLLAVFLVHELGHALFVRRFRRHVLAMELNGIGGTCRWKGEVTRIQRGSIAAGGIIAQTLLLAVAWGVNRHWPAHHAFTAQFVDALIRGNAWILVANLVPLPPFDGYDLWPLFPQLMRRWLWLRIARRQKNSKVREMALLSLDLSDGRLSPELQQQLDRIKAEVRAEKKRAAKQKP